MQEVTGQQKSRTARQRRLLSRPDNNRLETVSSDLNDIPFGLHPLGLNESQGTRDGLLYIPAGYRPGHPAPLVLMLHGAGDVARGGISPFLNHADAHGLILLAPDSRGRTWDVIMHSYGSDVLFLDRALSYVFQRYTIDTRHLAIEGFSDGASYALSLGLANGDLFTHCIAFSPGFIAPASWQDSPRIYVSHGKQDPVLPIERCSRRIVAELRNKGYDVSYHEFPGLHYVPSMVVRESLQWFLSPQDGEQVETKHTEG